MPDTQTIITDIPSSMEKHYASPLWQGFRTQPLFGPPGLQNSKDGAAVLDGWTYGMDGGAITAITAEDGSRWAYEHDANSRLTKAERYDTDGTTLLHRYSYTYDDGDNLLTKAVLDAVASVTTTTAFAYNDANELVTQAVGGTTTSFAYDAWGRMTSKSDGTYSATYAYRYGNKLASVTSDFPSEGNATYQYDGAGKRRQRTAGGTTTKYRWDMGWTVLNEEDNLGNLTRTYMGRGTAHVDGSNPSTGTWRFYVHDHLGSTRGVYNSDKTQYAAFEHTPYGELYASSGSTSDITRRYTGHDWDDAAELYYAPYRYYAPGAARWMTRDPLGMVDGPNMYGYSECRPSENADDLGLIAQPVVPFDAWRWLECCESAARKVVGKVLKEMKLEYGDEASSNTPRINFQRHCRGTCQLVRKVGLSCALAAAYGHEIEGIGQPGQFEWQDLLHNRVGQECGSLSGIFSRFIGGNATSDCRACCKKMAAFFSF